MDARSVIELQHSVRPRETVPAPSALLSVISVARSKEFLRFRERLITSRSDLVVRSVSPEDAQPLTHLGSAHLWIFCSTIELTQLVHLACSVRRHSAASRLLLVRTSRRPGFEDRLFHRIVIEWEGAGAFFDAVAALAAAA